MRQAEISERANRTLGPSPGGYDPYRSRYADEPSITIRPRWPEPPIDTAPAPNRYSPDVSSTRRSAPQYSIKNKPESSLTADKRLASNPAPSTYIITYKSTERSPPRHTLRSRVDTCPSSFTPGPDHYSPDERNGFFSARSGAPAFSFRDRTVPPKFDSETPGPAAYSNKHPFSANSPAFSFRDRHELLKPETLLIGPGSYDVSRKDYGRAALFAGRTYIRQRDQYPGPATYNPIIQPKHSPEFSFAGRNVPAPRSDSPGPIYNVETTFFAGQGITIKNKSPTRYENDVPGVGTYNTRQQNSRPSSAASIRSKESRLSDAFKNVPAPNAYNIEQQFVDRKGVRSPVHCYIGQKTSVLQEHNPTPGPGTYEVRGTFTKRQNGKEIQFSKEEVQEMLKAAQKRKM